jgi:electron transfer flavoprotein alpha subunit
MSVQDILVVVEIQRNAVADVTLELLTAARGLAAASGGQVVVLVLSGDGAPYVAALAAADRIVLVNDPQLAEYSPEAYLAVLAHVVAVEQPRAVLVGSTSIGWDVAPTLSARLGVPLVLGCRGMKVDGNALHVTASVSSGKVLADVRVERRPAILMVLPGSFAAATEPGRAAVESKTSPVPLAPGAVEFEAMILPEAGDTDITQQEVLVGVGRGIQQQDNLELAEELARALGGAVCASRPVVDQGWLPPTRQVGKSGMTVKPKLYLALGISGAPEHQEGMKGASLIVAVNTDPKAPIFDIAHYGAQVDVLDLLPALTEAVKAKQKV